MESLFAGCQYCGEEQWRHFDTSRHAVYCNTRGSTPPKVLKRNTSRISIKNLKKTKLIGPRCALPDLAGHGTITADAEIRRSGGDAPAFNDTHAAFVEPCTTHLC